MCITLLWIDVCIERGDISDTSETRPIVGEKDLRIPGPSEGFSGVSSEEKSFLLENKRKRRYNTCITVKRERCVGLLR